jgi:hypothetical protein
MKERIIRIIELLASLLARVVPQAVSLNLRFGLPTNKAGNCNVMTEIKITNAQKIKVTLNPTTQSGKPAQVDGKPTWEVVNGNSTVEVADDGKSADLVSSDDPGVTEVLIKADANLGEGVEEIAASIVLIVEGEHAANLGITVGEPQDK